MTLPRCENVKTGARISIFGAIYILSAAVIGLLALLSGNNFHYMAFAAALAYLAASTGAGIRNILGASVSVSAPDEIYAEVPFKLAAELKNKRRFFPIMLIKISAGGSSVFFGSTGAKGRTRSAVGMTLPRRGKHVIDKCVISSPYPFGLFTFRVVIPLGIEAIVFPEPLRGGAVFAEGDLGDTAGLTKAGDIAGVRSYEEGDSMREIHWKSSARTGSLKSKLYDESAGGGKIIDADKLTERGVETGLSAACGAIRGTLASGDAIGMKYRDKLYMPSSSRKDKLSMMAALALDE
ncbi:hypothetical protein FACS1894216_18540 [Synergistales bacterium]|nr:hypothetical protein FACS1894216_18540 [Synergistales bacterium]